jgi:hypothetical protein
MQLQGQGHTKKNRDTHFQAIFGRKKGRRSQVTNWVAKDIDKRSVQLIPN